MEHLRPLGDSEMSGTYLAHPTTVLAALAALEEYSRPNFYADMDAVGEHFYGGFQEIIDRSGVPVQLQYIGPRFGIPVPKYSTAQNLAYPDKAPEADRIDAPPQRYSTSKLCKQSLFLSTSISDVLALLHQFLAPARVVLGG